MYDGVAIYAEPKRGLDLIYRWLDLDTPRNVRIAALRQYRVERIADLAAVETVLENPALDLEVAQTLRAMVDRWQAELAADA